MIYRIQIMAIACVMALVAACADKPAASKTGEKPVLVATIPPIAMLLRELVGDAAEVRCLVPPGSSPHTFEPRPSDMRAVEDAAALFTAGPGLDDWAERLPTKNIFRIVDLIPEERLLRYEVEVSHGEGEHTHSHEEGTIDPHFWTDPETASFGLAGIYNVLPEVCPELDKKKLAENFGGLAAQHAALYMDIHEHLGPLKGRAVILFHSSFNYLLHRFGIRVAGVIEPAPGKEPSPKQLKELRDIIAREGITTIFTEPQLNPGPAQALAEAAGVKLAELDPNGGVPGRETYEELIRYNANVLAEALR